MSIKSIDKKIHAITLILAGIIFIGIARYLTLPTKEDRANKVERIADKNIPIPKIHKQNH